MRPNDLEEGRKLAITLSSEGAKSLLSSACLILQEQVFPTQDTLYEL